MGWWPCGACSDPDGSPGPFECSPCASGFSYPGSVRIENFSGIVDGNRPTYWNCVLSGLVILANIEVRLPFLNCGYENTISDCDASCKFGTPPNLNCFCGGAPVQFTVGDFASGFTGSNGDGTYDISMELKLKDNFQKRQVFWRHTYTVDEVVSNSPKCSQLSTFGKTTWSYTTPEVSNEDCELQPEPPPNTHSDFTSSTVDVTFT